MTGMASDGWAQIAGGGHVNDARIQVPAGAYEPNHSQLEISGECTLWFYSAYATIHS